MGDTDDEVQTESFKYLEATFWDTSCTDDSDKENKETNLVEDIEFIQDKVDQDSCKLHEYLYIDEMYETPQGALFKAKPTCSPEQVVTIKKADKVMSHDGTALQDEFFIVVEEDIVKEALILQHLTDNLSPTGNYIPEFIDFFESATDYYLVMQHVDGQTLRHFIDSAHQHIVDGKLQSKVYAKAIKFIMFQCMALLHWMHSVAHCCHGRVTVDSIMLQNAKFIEDHNGKLKVDPNLSIKLVDFGVAEIFKVNPKVNPKGNPRGNLRGNPKVNLTVNSFQCNKQDANSEHYPYVAPKVFFGEIYDARKADIFSLGMVLYHCLVGKPMYLPRDMWEVPRNGYRALMTNKLGKWLKQKDLLQYFQVQSLSALQCMLVLDESRRPDAGKMLKHPWFTTYYSQYEESMLEKMEKDLKVVDEIAAEMKDFPFYSME